MCDELDNDCDGSTDEGVTTTFYADDDGDGYGDTGTTAAACTAPSGYVAAAGDCDDAEADANPGEVEVCDEIDNDCDGVVDTDATDRQIFYADADGDGYGDPDADEAACAEPSGYVEDDGDCDDGDAAISPDADEVCDDVDNDCDGDIDDADSSLDTGTGLTWYADADGDGFGDPGVVQDACEVPSGYVADDTDCDDGNADANPDGEEICSGADADCDGVVDDLGPTAIYAGALAVLVPVAGNHGLWAALILFFAARGVTMGRVYPRIAARMT